MSMADAPKAAAPHVPQHVEPEIVPEPEEDDVSHRRHIQAVRMYNMFERTFQAYVTAIPRGSVSN